MMVFDLRCSGEHVFEAWFASSDAWREQSAAGLVVCPICGDSDVTKAVMAPRVGAKGNAMVAVGTPAAGTPAAGSPAAVKAALAAIAAHQAKLLERSTWVGGTFATRARAMHAGEEVHVPIHGQATLDEARMLADEGVPVAPLLVPVVPPELAN